jgi:hypothetical protein
MLALWAAAAPQAADQTTAGPMWATVNFCDGPGSPNAMGVRASMPGIPEADEIRVQFLAQYWSQQKQSWLAVSGSSASPWIGTGSAIYDYQQAGYTFRFDAPEPGKNFMVRAVANMQWLSGGKVVRTSQRVVRGGIPGVEVGNTSRGSCLIQ